MFTMNQSGISYRLLDEQGQVQTDINFSWWSILLGIAKIATVISVLSNRPVKYDAAVKEALAEPATH